MNVVCHSFEIGFFKKKKTRPQKTLKKHYPNNHDRSKYKKEKIGIIKEEHRWLVCCSNNDIVRYEQ